MQMNDNAMPTGGGASSGERPTMLTVLCILTFIAVGLGFLLNLLGIFGLSFLGDFGGGFAAAGITMIIPGLLLIAARGVGAFMMWQLKKNGFFIYAGVVAVEELVMPFVYGAIMGVGMGFNWFSMVISAIFIGLYYSNLKVMK